MIPGELRDGEAAEQWLATGFCLMRLGLPSAGELQLVAPWVLASLSELPALPPVGVVADIGRLLGGATLDYGSPSPIADPRLRGALRAYEDHVLGRLSADPRLEAASDAVLRLPPARRADAVALLVGHLCDRVRFPAGVAVSPGAARRALGRPAADLLRLGYRGLPPGDGGAAAAAIGERLALGYEELARAVRNARTLLTDSDVFTLENLTVLSSLTQRLAIEQVVEVAEELERTLPRRLKRRGQPRGNVFTQVEDESTYPIGGFSSVSTSGTLENLVTSELIYMDPPEENDGAGVDQFDLRYVEGELLYYTRDESIFVRRKRVIRFVLGAELTEARWKDAGLRWQRLVMVLGLVYCCVRRLCDWLHEEGLLFRVIFVDDRRGQSPLDEERALVEVLLREWIERGVVEVRRAPGEAGVLAEASLEARKAMSDVILIGTSLPDLVRSPSSRPDPRVHLGGLAVGEVGPVLRWQGSAPAEIDVEEAARDPWAAWCETVLDLLREMV